jgi:hypothetical protein
MAGECVSATRIINGPAEVIFANGQPGRSFGRAERHLLEARL